MTAQEYRVVGLELATCRHAYELLPFGTCEGQAQDKLLYNYPMNNVNDLICAANFISGPSRTADIEQTLVLGAHGPYRVHIVLVG